MKLFFIFCTDTCKHALKISLNKPLKSFENGTRETGQIAVVTVIKGIGIFIVLSLAAMVFIRSLLINEIRNQMFTSILIIWEVFFHVDQSFHFS